MCKVIINITYSIVTPESAEQGDYAEHGFISEGIEFESIDEAIDHIEISYGILERGNYTAFYTADSEIDCHDGSSTNYGIHFENKELGDEFWKLYNQRVLRRAYE